MEELLKQLKTDTEILVADILLPTREQKGDNEAIFRPADVYLMRVPDSEKVKKKAPYIIHQFITSKDIQTQGTRLSSTACVRSIFTVFNNDEQEGALSLLSLMERFRLYMLKKVIIGKRFTLDLEIGMESLAYPDDTAPYYAGEIVSTWHLPTVHREVLYE